jgi:hypothetical protein
MFDHHFYLISYISSNTAFASPDFVPSWNSKHSVNAVNYVPSSFYMVFYAYKSTYAVCIFFIFFKHRTFSFVILILLAGSGICFKNRTCWCSLTVTWRLTRSTSYYQSTKKRRAKTQQRLVIRGKSNDLLANLH